MLWTKPLRGKNQTEASVRKPRDLSESHSVSCSRVSPLRIMETLQQIHPTKELFHDFSSLTHARGHADPQFGGEHSGVVRPTGLTLRTLLQSVTGAVGPEQIRTYQVYLTKEKKLATGSILI